MSVNTKITVDEIYRLRASSALTNLTYKRTGDNSVPFSIYKSNLPGTSVAYVGREEIAAYFSAINEIADMAIQLAAENTRMSRELARLKSNNSPFG